MVLSNLSLQVLDIFIVRYKDKDFFLRKIVQGKLLGAFISNFKEPLL